MLIPPLATPPLLTRLNPPGASLDATVGELPFAANRLHREATALVQASCFHGCLYLAGYIAEIRLCYAYARFIRARPAAIVRREILPPAQKMGNLLWGRTYMATIFLSGHSPLFWWRLLLHRRIASGRPCGHRTQTAIDPVVDFVQSSWRVALRYREPLVQEREARELLRAVEYLDESSHDLWR